jgi:small-conductance mechanosensitive channel
MSTYFASFHDFTVANLFHLGLILLVALLLTRLLWLATKRIITPATAQTRTAQAREQQTRTLAGIFYGVGSKIVWVVALLTAVQEFGINVLPAVVLAGLLCLALAFGAQNLVRDVITGFYILLEDQYVVGDTIQVLDSTGRVEQLTLRRTILRDSRGALVTIANGDIRTVSNLSRDWSQTFVDVGVSPLAAQEETFKALDAAIAGLRADPSWSLALVDGPRILGLQSYDQSVSTVRIQIRTAPSRQEDVARELRRRIQLEFQKQAIPPSSVQHSEMDNTGAREFFPPARSS